MEVAALATKMSYISVVKEVNVGMMEKALDKVELAGEQIAMMIQATAVMPSDGSTIDIRI